ncbi:hypothetical protein BGX24_012130 [Mortierella sp. AD032]|nr:hypothetical protein BGX24_012130 [Mortierella sp. AD032]
MESTFAKNLNRLRIILVILSVMNIFPCMFWFIYKPNVMKQFLTVEDGFKILSATLLFPFNMSKFEVTYYTKARIFITGPIVVATLVLYIKHLVQGSAFGFDGVCALEKQPPLQQLQQQQPPQEQKEPEQHEPRQSILSSATTLKDEEAKSEKSLAKQHSVINIDTLDDNDLILAYS